MKKYHVATGDGKGYYAVGYETYREAKVVLEVALRRDPKAHIVEEECRFTNADRIRAMSDEKLAEFLCDRMAHCDPRYCPGCETCGIEIGKASGLKNWLQQPAEEG